MMVRRMVSGAAFLALLIVVTACGPQHVPVPVSRRASTPSAPVLTAIQPLDMMTPSIGWALTPRGVYHTTAGPREWHGVLPLPAYTANVFPLLFHAPSSTTFWLVRPVSPTDEGYALWWTQSSGHRWHHRLLPAGNTPISLVEQSSRAWWYLVSPNGPAMNFEQWTLYHTTNAGDTWTTVATTVGSRALSQTLTVGNPVGLIVRGSSLWIPERQYGTHATVLESETAGRTWHQIILPTYLRVMTPVSIAAWTALSTTTTMVLTSPTGTALASTRTGRTWSITPVPPDTAGPVEPLPKENWVVATPQAVWTTTHNGTLWHRHALPAGKGVRWIDFLNPKSGWIGVFGVAQHSGIMVYHTYDGGKHWTLQTMTIRAPARR